MEKGKIVNDFAQSKGIEYADAMLIHEKVITSKIRELAHPLGISDLLQDTTFSERGEIVFDNGVKLEY